jgi:hypothetical protein
VGEIEGILGEREGEFRRKEGMVSGRMEGERVGERNGESGRKMGRRVV